MKNLVVFLILWVSITTLRAQRQEITFGVNRNHFYDFHKTARSFESKDQNGLSLSWSFDNMDTKKFPLRASIKLDRYQGDVNIFNGGLGGGVTLDAAVAKHMIAIGLYPLNFKIKRSLNFNFGVEFNALILEKAKGSFSYYQGGSPPISSNIPLDDGNTRASNNFGIGVTSRVAYYISMKNGWSLVPQYQIFAGVSDEFRINQSETRSLRHYLAIGLAKKPELKRTVPKNH